MTFEQPEPNLWFAGGEPADGLMLAISWRRDARARLVLRPLDGPPVLVFVADGVQGGTCFIDNFRFEADTAHFTVWSHGPQRAGAWFAGPLREDPAWRAPIGPAEGSNSIGLSIMNGRTFISRAPGVPEGRVVGWFASLANGTLFGSGERGDGIELVRPGGSPRRLVDVRQDQQLGGVVVDGDRLYWLVGDVAAERTDDLSASSYLEYFDVQLWTATAPRGDEPLVARRVTKIDGVDGGELPQLRARHGKVVYTTYRLGDRRDSLDLHILDATTGRYETPGLPKDIPVSGVVLLTRTDLFVTRKVAGTHWDNGLVHLRLDEAL